MSDQPDDSVKSPLGRTLLASAKADGPGAGSADRALSMLLVGGAAGTIGAASATAKAGAATSVPATGTGAAAAGVAGGAAAIAKWVGLGVLALSAVTATVVLSNRADVNHPSNPIAAPTPTVPQATPSATARSTLDDLQPAPTAPSLAPSAAPPPSPAKSPRPAPPLASELTEETAELDVARSKLAAGDARGALSSLDEFDTKHPRATLRDEALIVRLDALNATGERARATALARAFLAEHPTSPYARRLRSRFDLGDEP